MTQLYKRQFSLIVGKNAKGLDLSQFRVKFQVSQADFESPNNAYIRVYNLSAQTVKDIQEYNTVTLQGGYPGAFGIIFQGQIKQFGIGRESNKDTYVDLFCADGTEGYNYGVTNKTLAPGAKQQDALQAAIDSMAFGGLYLGYAPGDPGVTLPRGKVLFAMGRDIVRQYANTNKCSWSIQNGAIQIIPLNGYKPGEVPVLSAATGLLGQPEQNQEGINFKHLMNPLLTVGQAVRIDNKSVNQILQANRAAAPIPYNQRTGIQELAKVSTDGLYRLLVVEHSGDTRGPQWESNCVALAIDASSGKVKPYGS